MRSDAGEPRLGFPRSGASGDFQSQFSHGDSIHSENLKKPHSVEIDGAGPMRLGMRRRSRRSRGGSNRGVEIGSTRVEVKVGGGRRILAAV
eukprot:1177146-Prorocentrum_minimum.AAC.2